LDSCIFGNDLLESLIQSIYREANTKKAS